MNTQYSLCAESFLNDLFLELQTLNIQLPLGEVDHLCYRTESIKEYLEVCADFNRQGHLLIESMVGGRLISTFKLHTPFIYKDFSIPLVEIPAPKMSSPHVSGFEHIEMVVTESFDELIKRYSSLQIETRALQKRLNPELEIVFKSGSVKFHHQSLEKIIEIENNEYERQNK